MRRHLAVLTGEAQPNVGRCWKGSSRFSSHLVGPSLQPSQKHQCYAKSPFCHCLPKGHLQQQEDRNSHQFENMFTVLFPFFVGFPPPVLEVEDAYPLAGTDVNITCSGHVLTSPSPTLDFRELQTSLLPANRHGSSSLPGRKTMAGISPVRPLWRCRASDCSKPLRCSFMSYVSGGPMVLGEAGHLVSLLG